MKAYVTLTSNPITHQPRAELETKARRLRKIGFTSKIVKTDYPGDYYDVIFKPKVKKLELRSLDDLCELQRNVGDELILRASARGLEIEIYNDWRE